MYHVSFTSTPESPTSIRFIPRPVVLKLQAYLGAFDTNAQSDPKMTLNTIRSNVPHIYPTSTPSPSCHSLSLYD